MSDHDRPDLQAFRELEELIRVLGDEMAGWRRRAQVAESRLRDLQSASATPSHTYDERHAALEHENSELRSRLDMARQRVRQLMERMRFLRQQLEAGAER